MKGGEILSPTWRVPGADAVQPGVAPTVCQLRSQNMDAYRCFLHPTNKARTAEGALSVIMPKGEEQEDRQLAILHD